MIVRVPQPPICRECYEYAEPNKKRCKKHLRYHCFANFKHRQRKLEKGLCRYNGCHASPAEKHSMCLPHVKKTTEAVRKCRAKKKGVSI